MSLYLAGASKARALAHAWRRMKRIDWRAQWQAKCEHEAVRAFQRARFWLSRERIRRQHVN